MTSPRCRNCHKGSSGCGACHNTDHSWSVLGNNADPLGGTSAGKTTLITSNSRQAITFLFAAMFNFVDPTGAKYGFTSTTSTAYQSYEPNPNNGYGYVEPDSIMAYAPVTGYETTHTSDGELNEITNSHLTVDARNEPIAAEIKNSRTVTWSQWRNATGIVNSTCSDDGLSFPHRTLGWKMLKDDLFGIDPANGDVDGKPALVGAGQKRAGYYGNSRAHDIDSVCLDCHNPTVWNATSQYTHTDDPNNPNDNANDDLIMRGLP